MVRYELSLILRAVGRGQPLPPLLRAACEVVLGQGALLRRLENMGERALPYGMFAHGQRFDRGRLVRVCDLSTGNNSEITLYK